MNLDNLTAIDQLAEFLAGTQTVAFSVLSSPTARYEWVQKTLIRFRYLTLSRADQGVVIRVLMKVSGYSRQQITRLIAQGCLKSRLLETSFSAPWLSPVGVDVIRPRRRPPGF